LPVGSDLHRSGSAMPNAQQYNRGRSDQPRG